MSPVLAGAARAKADIVVAEAWSARLDAPVGAGRRQEDLIVALDAEASVLSYNQKKGSSNR